MRFLAYAVAAMSYLEFLLFLRIQVLWDKRAEPSVGHHAPLANMSLKLVLSCL